MLLTRESRKEVESRFSVLKKPVTLAVFTQQMECQSCRETRMLCEELAEVTSKIAVEVNDFREDKNLVDKYEIERIPAVVVAGKNDFAIRYYGAPSGYIFDSLLNVIRMISLEKVALTDETIAFLDSLPNDLKLKVLVSPTCPNCPQAVELACRLAYSSPRVSVEIVNLTDFPWLAIRYQATAVPRTMVNEHGHIEGALSEKSFVEKLEAFLKP